MVRLWLRLLIAFAIAPIPACATKVITFKTSGPARVDLLPAGKLDEPGKELGQTPLTVEVETLRGQVVRVSQPGKLPMYWVVADVAGDTTDAAIKLADDPARANAVAGGESKVDTKASVNRVMRLLLQSYQALSGRRFQAARDLADQVAAIDPELAAPQVIKGLSHYQEGNLAEAKTTLQKAQALDPEDKNIDELLKVMR